MEVLEWTLHLSTDTGGNPQFCWMHMTDPKTAQELWVGDAEWGPFDSAVDVTRWLLRTMGAYLSRRPG